MNLLQCAKLTSSKNFESISENKFIVVNLALKTHRKVSAKIYLPWFEQKISIWKFYFRDFTTFV